MGNCLNRPREIYWMNTTPKAFSFSYFFFWAFVCFPVFAYIFAEWLLRRANGVPAYFAPESIGPLDKERD